MTGDLKKRPHYIRGVTDGGKSDYTSPTSGNEAYIEHGGGGGGDSGDGDLERRVEALEKGMDDIKAVLKEIQAGQQTAALRDAERAGEINTRLASIDAKLDAKATKTDVAAIETKLATVDGKLIGVEGKVGLLPTTTAMITTTLSAVGLSLAGAAGLAFTLFKIFKP